jgi:hypothetical protein
MIKDLLMIAVPSSPHFAKPLVVCRLERKKHNLIVIARMKKLE